MAEVRNRLAAGDLRALYLLWLCAAIDSESVDPDVVEPPVPGGLAEVHETFGPCAEFSGLDPLIVIAAAEGSPAAPAQSRFAEVCRDLVEQLSDVDSQQLLLRFLTEEPSAVRSALIATIREHGESCAWPTVSLDRSFQTILERTEVIRANHDAKEEKKRDARCQA